MSHYTISLKGETYYIPYSRKKMEVKKMEDEIENYKNMIKELEQKKKVKQFELLDDRQLIIYLNQYPKSLSSEMLKDNKQYQKRVKLLQSYDNIHGTYLSPTI